MTTEDKYETLEKIGHGSFGIIRKVRRKTDGFVMCRKEISYLRMSQKEREQLHAEFQILSHLRHPNIVAYYHREHLKMSQDLHLYMEYCGNGDLGRVIKDLQNKGQRAPESFVWSVFSQLTLALYRCHYGVDPPEVGTNVLGFTKGNVHTPKVPAGTMTILHRDLKPENVFLDEDNSVKLGDFGLSKMIKSHDFASTYVGTPFYMSPEICAAEKYTLKSDIWSMGCIIYELCSREPPFNAKTHFQLVQKIKEGKVAPLPEMYSTELNNVIRDCLRVNPDRRPDTAQILNLPVVKLMRKEKEVVELNKSLRARETGVKNKEKELNEKLARLEHDKVAAHNQMEDTVRREWEVKARLEIDRLVQAEFEKLRRQFDEELRARVADEVQKRTATAAAPAPIPAAAAAAVTTTAPAVQPPTRHELPPAAVSTGSSARSEYPPHSPLGTSSCEDISSTTDNNDYLLESPDTSREAREPRKTARTPFGRAQTMFAGGAAGTPMDIEMASPSPIALASLSLSPRRTGVTKAPSRPEGNIFSVNNGSDDPLFEESDDDDEDDVIIPSPTRHIKSSKNPFTSKSRPVLPSQKTAPANALATAGGLRPKTSSSGLVSKVGLGAPPPPAPSTLAADERSRSPTRRLSKIPSAANLAGDAARGRKDASATNGGNKTDGGEALGRLAAKNNIKGRTLVELQQARAGGRPVTSSSTAGSENNNGASTASAKSSRNSATSTTAKSRSPRRRVHSERGGSGGSGAGSRPGSAGASAPSSLEPVATWDPDRDEMPSPFLVKTRRVKV